MPVLLYGIGVFALFAGLVMVGFGIPINEFSFGNTLISAGTTAVVGGLIIIGLGVVAGQIRRMVEAISVQSSARFGQPMDTLEIPAVARGAIPQGRVPFPPRSKSEGELAAHASTTTLDDEHPAQTYAPTLRNPDEPSVAVEDDISLSPHQPSTPTSPAAGSPFGSNGSGMGDKSRESMADWRSPLPPASPGIPPQPRPLHNANFDAMWPAEEKPLKSPPAGEFKPEPKISPPSRDAAANAPRSADPEGQKSRAVAILKSGVVDGMGYTLYVDGSIEAELPQGTLHFASINELRNHLGKGS
ncbi:MAG: hypothetical protein WBG10_04625 [Pseudolabrys sp.]